MYLNKIKQDIILELEYFPVEKTKDLTKKVYYHSRTIWAAANELEQLGLLHKEKKMGNAQSLTLTPSGELIAHYLNKIQKTLQHEQNKT